VSYYDPDSSRGIRYLVGGIVPPRLAGWGGLVLRGYRTYSDVLLSRFGAAERARGEDLAARLEVEDAGLTPGDLGDFSSSEEDEDAASASRTLSAQEV
jgi:hypothetical protein